MQNKLPPTNCSLLESMTSVFIYQTKDQCNNRPINGFICMGCDLLGVCIKRNNKWEAIPVEVCATNDGYQCNEFEGACSNKTGPCNPINKGAFTCTSVGIFPDPYDCQLYHTCYMNGNLIISADIKCNIGMAFNPLSGDCSLNLNANVCQEYGFTCEKAGNIGPWLHNPNFFYVCKRDVEDEKVIYPELYKCDPNETFIKDECVPKDVSTQIPSTTHTVPNVDGFTCTKPGIYVDTTSCLHYIYCDAYLQAYRYLCPESTHFSQVYLSCSAGSC